MARMEQGQKRSRPDLEVQAEEDCRQLKRVSEVLSDSTCNSDMMLVERIHSGLPVMPGEQKMEGASEALFSASEDDGNRGPRAQPSVFDTLAKKSTFPGFGMPRDDPVTSSLKTYSTGSPYLHGSKARTSPPQSGAIRNEFNNFQAKVSGGVSNTASSAGTGAAPAIAPGSFLALSYTALQQQMTLLFHDEQALLRELRSMRRAYDARVAALSACKYPSANNAASTRNPAQHTTSLPPAPRLPPKAIGPDRGIGVRNETGCGPMPSAANVSAPNLSSRGPSGRPGMAAAVPASRHGDLRAAAVAQVPKKLLQGLSAPDLMPPPPPPSAQAALPPASAMPAARQVAARAAPPVSVEVPLLMNLNPATNASLPQQVAPPRRASQPSALTQRPQPTEEPVEQVAAASTLAALASKHLTDLVGVGSGDNNAAVVRQLLLTHVFRMQREQAQAQNRKQL